MTKGRGRVQPLPTAGTISALNIPHCSIVFNLYEATEIRAELLGDAGVAIETIKQANIVSFTCLKALAFDQRFERKDVHDLTYCIEHAPDGLDSVVAAFREALAGKHGAVVRESLSILRRRFAGEGSIEGFRKDGPVAVARFEKGEGGEPDLRDARLLRQREVRASCRAPARLDRAWVSGWGRHKTKISFKSHAKSAPPRLAPNAGRAAYAMRGSPASSRLWRPASLHSVFLTPHSRPGG